MTMQEAIARLGVSVEHLRVVTEKGAMSLEEAQREPPCFLTLIWAYEKTSDNIKVVCVGKGENYKQAQENFITKAQEILNERNSLGS